MADGALLELAYEGNRSFFELLAAEVYSAPGVGAAIVAKCPDRSVLNCVSYSDSGALDAALDGVATAYAAAGVRAWTVWVPAADGRAAALLEAAGHVLDGAPMAMGAAVADIDAAEPGSIDWIEAPDHSAVGPLNDLAYGSDGSFTAALAGTVTDGRVRTYVARVSGEPASCVMTLDHGDDCHVGLVATTPAAQRRGLAGALLGRALVDALAHGARTTTLIASSAGRPLYERIGYRPLAPIEMWERRRG